MNNLKDQTQLRDNIAGVMEISRESWKAGRSKTSSEDGTQVFPRSALFRTVSKHPILSAAAVASIWFLKPSKLGALAVAGGSLVMRHHLAILPLAQRVFSSSRHTPSSAG